MRCQTPNLPFTSHESYNDKVWPLKRSKLNFRYNLTEYIRWCHDNDAGEVIFPSPRATWRTIFYDLQQWYVPHTNSLVQGHPLFLGQSMSQKISGIGKTSRQKASSKPNLKWTVMFFQFCVSPAFNRKWILHIRYLCIYLAFYISFTEQ